MIRSDEPLIAIGTATEARITYFTKFEKHLDKTAYQREDHREANRIVSQGLDPTTAALAAFVVSSRTDLAA